MLHILYSHKQISPTIPKNNTKKNTPAPIFEEKKLLIINPLIKVINSGGPNLDFKSKYHYITYLTLFSAKRGSYSPLEDFCFYSLLKGSHFIPGKRIFKIYLMKFLNRYIWSASLRRKTWMIEYFQFSQR